MLNKFGKVSWHLCWCAFIFRTFLLYAFLFICDHKSKHTLTHMHLSAQANYANGIWSMYVEFNHRNGMSLSFFSLDLKCCNWINFICFTLLVRKMFIWWFFNKKKLSENLLNGNWSKLQIYRPTLIIIIITMNVLNRRRRKKNTNSNTIEQLVNHWASH